MLEVHVCVSKDILLGGALIIVTNHGFYLKHNDFIKYLSLI